MNIDELTLGQMKEIKSMIGCENKHKSYPYPVGKNVLIRTVTMALTGHLIEVTETELVLERAAWIADIGRYHIALRDGILSEVEPFPDGRVIVGRGSVVDVCEWNHELPRDAK